MMMFLEIGIGAMATALVVIPVVMAMTRGPSVADPE